MRGLHTQVSDLRKDVFVEVARIAYESDNINDDLESIPYKLSPDENPRFRDSVYRERAVSSERTRLALGLSLRPQNKPVHITSGLDEATVDEMYYEPPLMQVIPSACNACEDNVYEVSNLCQWMSGTFHAWRSVRGMRSHMWMGRHILTSQNVSNVENVKVLVRMMRSVKRYVLVPLPAVSKQLESDEYGRAVINQDKCLSCGMCMVSCPFGAIADKSQIFQLIRCMKEWWRSRCRNRTGLCRTVWQMKRHRIRYMRHY